MKTLTWEPLISLAWWAALAVAAAGLLVWYGYQARRWVPIRRLALILPAMAIGLALPLAILLNPTWRETLRPPLGKPLLTILVDGSASMSTPDGAAVDAADGAAVKSNAGTTRYAAVCACVGDLIDRLKSDYEIRVERFSDRVAPAEPDTLGAQLPQGDRTDLARAIDAAAETDRLAGRGVVLVSDGVHNGGGGSARVLEAARCAGAMAAPVFVKTFGGAAVAVDVAAQARSPLEVVYVGQKLRTVITLEQHGLAGRRATVRLLREDQEIETRETTLKSNGSTDIEFELSEPKTGAFRYQVRVDPLAGETTDANNSAPLLVRAVDEPVRVLIVEGKPYWDTRFLVRALAADASLAVTSIVRLAEGRLLEQTYHPQRKTEQPLAADTPAKAVPEENADAAKQPAATAPIAEPPVAEPSVAKGPAAKEPGGDGEEWKIRGDAKSVFADAQSLGKYQIVILGRDADVFLDDVALTNLQTWMARGGGSLVCYRGAPTAEIVQNLARLLPVRWSPARESRFQVQWTDRGKQLRWFPGSDEQAGETFSGLPSLATTAQVDRAKPLAVVLAAAGDSTQPAIVYQPFGSGRAVVVEGAGMWRWAFLPPQRKQQDDVYGALWHNLVRWLVANVGLLPDQRALLAADNVSFAAGEPATATLLVRPGAAQGQPLQVALSGPTGEAPRVLPAAPSRDDPDTYRIVFGALGEGRYQARIATPALAGKDVAGETSFEVRRNYEERLELKARPDLMAMIAQLSGGAVLGDDPAADLAKHFDAHLARMRPDRVRRSPAWDRWWALVGVCAIWAMAWTVRRRSGLV